MSTAPGAQLPYASVPNLRDVGGYPTEHGTVRTGVLYRSTALDRATATDLDALAALGIRTVVDLRTAAERDAAPDRVPDGAKSVEFDVLADSAMAAPAELGRILRDPAFARSVLSGDDVQSLFEQAYRETVRLPSAMAGFRGLYLAMLEADRTPLLYHCTTGKDRTGWATAALLLLIGVSEQDVVSDYLLSTGYLLEGLAPLLDQFEAAGGDRDFLVPILGVREEYLRAALDEMHTLHGGIEDYFAAIGVDPAAQAALREKLVEASPAR